MTAGRAPRPPRNQTKARTLFGIGSGNAMEWFDWGVYTTFTPFFASQFFHSGDAVSDVLKTLSCSRSGSSPGRSAAWLFGWIADKKGRKLSMTLTVALAAAAASSSGSARATRRSAWGRRSSWCWPGSRRASPTAASCPRRRPTSPRRRRGSGAGLWSSLIYFSGTIGQLAGTLLAAILSTVLTQER